MNYLESLTSAVTDTFLPTKYREVFQPELGLEGIDPDEGDYRRLTQSSKDIPTYQHERMQRIAFWLYISNPLAYRITELTKDFTIGKGISYECEDERIREVLDAHWNDPVNNWDINQHQRILQLGLYGEVFNPVFVNDVNGHVRIGTVDPVDVHAVLSDPDNIEIAKTVIMKSKTGLEGKKYAVVQHNGDGILEGEILISQLKRVTNMTRGIPDMSSVLDYMDAFDGIMFGELERIQLQRAWVEDITLEGFTDIEIKDWVKQNGKAPEWGTRWAHNEKVSRQFLSPKIESADLAGFMRMILAIILGGVGVPEHYFALAYDINRATSDNMEPPLIRRVETRQRFVRGYFTQLFNFVITQAALHNRQTEKGALTEADLKKNDTFNYQIIFPDPSQKDIEKTAASIVQLTNALIAAETQEWVSKEKSAEIFAVLAQEFGVDIDITEQFEKIKDEKIVESVGIYAYQELKDFIDWFQSKENGGLKEAVRREVKMRLRNA